MHSSKQLSSINRLITKKSALQLIALRVKFITKIQCNLKDPKFYAHNSKNKDIHRSYRGVAPKYCKQD